MTITSAADISHIPHLCEMPFNHLFAHTRRLRYFFAGHRRIPPYFGSDKIIQFRGVPLLLVSDTLARKQLMNIQTGNEIASFLIRFKLRSGRTILIRKLYLVSHQRI